MARGSAASDLASLISETEASIARSIGGPAVQGSSGAGGQGHGSGSNGSASDAVAAAQARASVARHASQLDAQLAASRAALAAAQSSLGKSGSRPMSPVRNHHAGPIASAFPHSSSNNRDAFASSVSSRFEEQTYSFASPGRPLAGGQQQQPQPRASSSSPPPPVTRRPVTPSSFSPSKLFHRPGHSTASTSRIPPRPSPLPAAASPTRSPVRPLPVPHVSPLSPREQARMEIAKHSVNNRLGRSTGLGMRSPHLTSPPASLRGSYEPGATIGAGGSFSASGGLRSRSLSPPGRFASAAAASRSNAHAAAFDATMKFENLESSPSRAIRRSPVPGVASSPSRRFGPISPARSSSNFAASVRAASASPTRSPLRSSPVRSPPRFATARPSPLDGAASRAGAAALAAASASSAAHHASNMAATSAYVHAQLEPWRELNRQLALNGFPLVHPFPVPVSVAPTDALPWSPRSSKVFRDIGASGVNATPSASLTLLLTTCANLLADYGRRGATIEELMRKHAETSSSHLHCHAEIAALRRGNQQQSYQIADLQSALEHSSQERASSLATLTQQVDKSAHNFSALESKLAQTNLQLAHKEEQMAEMRFRLEEAQARAERKVAQETDRLASTLRERDAAASAAQQQASIARRELENQLSDCQLALLAVQAAKKDSDDESARREAHSAQVAQLRALEHEERVRSLQIEYEKELANERAKSRALEAELVAKLRATEESLGLATGQVNDLTALNAVRSNELAQAQREGALLEEQVHNLRTRAAQQSELQREMEAKVAALQAQAVHGYNVQELSRHLNSAQMGQLVSRDAAGSSFDSNRLGSLPQEVLAELLSSVCHKLKLNDASAVPSTLDSLVSVASAVPGMQEFIAQIWALVQGNDPHANNNGSGLSNLSANDLVSLTTSVIPTLRSWAYAASASRGLSSFRAEVLDVLRRRQHRSPLNPLYAGASAHVSNRIHADLPNEEVLLELNDIVANENRLNALVYDQNSPSGFFQLWAAMDKSPLLNEKHYSADSEKIIAHLQQLFDIPHRIGLFPKINELFLFVNETRPAIQALRSLLRLDSRATIQTCIKQLKRVVEGGNSVDVLGESIGAGGSLDRSFASVAGSSYRTSHSPARSSSQPRSSTGGAAWTVTSPSRHESSFLTTPAGHGSSAGGSSAPTASQMQRNAHYYTVCKQLKTILNARKIADIVPAVQKLQLESSSRPTPSAASASSSSAESNYLAHSILAQLKAQMEVSSITSLPSAVSWLRNNYETLKRSMEEAERSRGGSSSTSGATSVAAQELARLSAKREEFIAHLKNLAGIAGEDDAALVGALQRATAGTAAGSSTGAGGSSSSSSSYPSSKEHSQIIMQLKGYLDVASVSDIVNTVRTLINKVHSYDELYPKLDYMVSQLYALLGISTLEAIVPSVRSLLTSGGGAARNTTTAGGSTSGGSGPLASSSTMRGSINSNETSPSLSAISDASSMGGHRGGAGVGASGARPTASSSSSSVLYSAGRSSAVNHSSLSSPYPGRAPPSHSPFRAHVTFDEQEGGGIASAAAAAAAAGHHPHQQGEISLASYAPGQSSARKPSPAPAQRRRDADDEAIDRMLQQRH